MEASHILSNLAIIVVAVAMKETGPRLIDSMWHKTSFRELAPGSSDDAHGRIITDGQLPEVLRDPSRGDVASLLRANRNLLLTDVAYVAEVVGFYSLLFVSTVNAVGHIDVIGASFSAIGVVGLLIGRVLFDWNSSLEYFHKKRWGSPSRFHLLLLVVVNAEPLVRALILY